MTQEIDSGGGLMLGGAWKIGIVETGILCNDEILGNEMDDWKNF